MGLQLFANVSNKKSDSAGVHETLLDESLGSLIL
jgi:hypothetical protein